MSDRMQRQAKSALSGIVSHVEGVSLIDGSLMLTVLAAGDPVITVTTVMGVYLVGLKRQLDARPHQSGTVRWVTANRDPDWHYFQSPNLNDLRRAVHLALPRIEALASRDEELDAMLAGRVVELDVGPDDSAYWDLLARWVSRTGALTRSRNVAKYARAMRRHSEPVGNYPNVTERGRPVQRRRRSPLGFGQRRSCLALEEARKANTR